MQHRITCTQPSPCRTVKKLHGMKICLHVPHVLSQTPAPAPASKGRANPAARSLQIACMVLNVDVGMCMQAGAGAARRDAAPAHDMPAPQPPPAPTAAPGPSQQRADTHAAEMQRMRDLLSAKDNTIQQLTHTNTQLTQDKDSAAALHGAALQEARVTIQQLRQKVQGHTQALRDRDVAMQQLTQINTQLTQDLAARDQAMQHMTDTVHQITQERDRAVAMATLVTQERDALRADVERVTRDSEQWEISAVQAEMDLRQAQSQLLANRLAVLQRGRNQ